MVKRLGKLDTMDLSFLTNDKGHQYINYLQNNCGVVNFNLKNEIYGCSSDDEIKKMVESLLEFNPYFRKSMKECLTLKVFDQFKVNHFETLNFSKIYLKVDRDEAYSYEDGKSHIYNRDDYLNIIINEVNEIHS